MRQITISVSLITTILALIFVTGLILIIGIFFINFGLQESSYNFLGKTKKITLDVGLPVTQTFTSRRNGMNQIRIPIGNSSLHLQESILFELLDENCATPLAASRFYAWSADWHGYYAFAFPAIPESRDKSYCFRATFSSDKNLKGEKPTIAATQDPEERFSDRVLTDANKNKRYPGQTLFLRPAYTTGTVSGDISVFIDRMSQYKPWFFKGYFLVTWGILSIGGAILLAGLLVFRKPDDGTELQ
jgi:hypothetical protein